MVPANDTISPGSTSLTNTLTDPVNGYVPIGDLAQSDGVATLGPDGFVPAGQLNIDEKIQDTTALMFTSATHSNITVAYDDNTGRLSLTGIPLTQEQVQSREKGWQNRYRGPRIGIALKSRARVNPQKPRAEHTRTATVSSFG